MKPPASFTAVDGTRWEFYDFRIIDRAGAPASVRVELGSLRAEYRAFRSADRPELGKITYRFHVMSSRDTGPQTLKRQIAEAIAMREAGTQAGSAGI